MATLTEKQLNDIAGHINNGKKDYFLTNHFDFCAANELNPYSVTVLAMTLGNAYGYIMGTLNGAGKNTYGEVDINAETRETLIQINYAFNELMKQEAGQ